VGALQGRQVDRCGLIEEILALLFIESIPEAENPILAVVSEAAECFLEIWLSVVLVPHALCLTPWESRAYSTAHPKPERAPPTARNHSSEAGEIGCTGRGFATPAQISPT
jgi:hypothetical protein